jgi:hypothetical protein
MSIKVAFADFWGGFNYNPDINVNSKEMYYGDNTLYDILSERYDIETSTNPDVLIYSVFGNSHTQYSCKKVFYTGENMRPNYNQCDYSLTFDYLDDERNYRFPLSAITLYESGIRDKFPKEIDFDKIKKEKTKFCNFVFSNPNAQLRNQLFYELSKYKQVDSGGRALNNIGYAVSDKLEFINNYKFTICFENSEYPGYTTEKLVHPKLKNSIPIYWGNPRVGEDWNTKSFINAYDFKDINSLIDYIKEVDNDDNLYENILKESHFLDDKLPHDLDTNNLLDFFEKIFKNEKKH